jgi:class 3 adenylate cyclase
MLRIKALQDTVQEQAARLEAQAAQLREWNQTLEQKVAEQVSELDRVSRLRRFLAPQLADVIVSSGDETLLENHRREITVVFCDLRGFTAFAETAEPEEVMGIIQEYHGAMGELIFRYEGTLEHFSGDGVMVFFNDPLPVRDPAVRAAQMAVAIRERVGALTEHWRKRGYELGVGLGIAMGFATLGKIGFEGRFDYAAIGTVSNVASRLCDEAQPGQILISPRVLMAVENVVSVEPTGEMTLKGIRRPLPVHNVVDALRSG